MNTATLAVGAAVVYDTNSDDGVTVRTTTASADGAFAGILVTALQTADSSAATSAQDDAGRRNWAYVQVHGPASATILAGGAGAATVGDPVITSTDAGTVSSLTAGTVGASTIAGSALKAYGNSGGFFLDTPGTADTSVDVFLKLE